MKKLKILSVLCIAFLLEVFFAQPALAILGDCAEDGAINSADVVAILNFVSSGVPPSTTSYPVDCDCDGTLGINYGDALQLVAYLYIPAHPPLISYTGEVPSSSDIQFTLPVILRGGTDPFDVTVELTDNPGPDLMGMYIPFSYQDEPGGIELELNSVSFVGSIVPAGWTKQGSYDNFNKRGFLWICASSSTDPPFATGTTGLIATLNFTRIANPTGFSTYLTPTLYPPTHSPILITSYYEEGAPPFDRILIPKYKYEYWVGITGDCNCDGIVESADIVCMLNNLYVLHRLPPQCGW